MKKPKVHKVKHWWADSLGGYGMSHCCVWLFPRNPNYRKTWRGVPVADRCKNCLWDEGKR